MGVHGFEPWVLSLSEIRLTRLGHTPRNKY